MIIATTDGPLPEVTGPRPATVVSPGLPSKDSGQDIGAQQ